MDEDGDNSHEQMTNDSHYELSLVQADGRFDLERRRGYDGDADDLFDGPAARFADDTNPNSKWWNGTASNLTIDQISPAGEVMTFRCLLGPVAPPPGPVSRVSAPNRLIPDNTPQGISDTIEVAESLTLASLKVGLEITHTYRGDLRVTLTTPWGTMVELHPKGGGGSAHDLNVTYDETTLPALATLRGRSAQGIWRLLVQDLAPADTGRLVKWSLEFRAANQVGSDLELKEAPGTPIPDHPADGIERALTAAGGGTVGSVEVSVDIAHTWIGDLRVALVSPAATEVVLHEGSGGSQQNLVRTYTAANTPALTGLSGQPVAGSWRLRVVDQAPQDQGKLNSWRILIKAPVA